MMAATASLKSSLLLPSPISDFSGAAVSISTQVTGETTNTFFFIQSRQELTCLGNASLAGRRGGGHGSRGAQGCRCRQQPTPRTFLSWEARGSLASSCPGSSSRRAIRSVSVTWSRNETVTDILATKKKIKHFLYFFVRSHCSLEERLRLRSSCQESLMQSTQSSLPRCAPVFLLSSCV
jgi:hypothetical protein